MSDSDGDGRPDEIEVSGLPCSNGMIFFTDPDKADTDGDGLNDSEEVIPVIERRRYYPVGTPDEAVSYKYYFEFRSDPTKVDSDGDGVSDTKDKYPLGGDPNPFSPENIESIKIIYVPSSEKDFTLSIIKSSKFENEAFFAYAEGVTNQGGFLITDKLKDVLNNYEESYNNHLIPYFYSSTIEAAVHAAKKETDQLVPQYFEYGSSAYYGSWLYNTQAEIDLLNEYSKFVEIAEQAYMIYLTVLMSYHAELVNLDQQSVTLSKKEYVSSIKKTSINNSETIWDRIHGTAEKLPATEIPATFKIDLNNDIKYINPQTQTNTLWTNSNATEHFGEYINRFGASSESIGIRSQVILESYSSSLNKAMADFVKLEPGRHFGLYGGWELGINTKTGVVYHALMR